MADNEVPEIVDKINPIEEMRARRMKHTLLMTNNPGDTEDRRMLLDALEFIQTFSEDPFSRLMAQHAMGRRL